MENVHADLVSRYINTTNCNVFLTGKAGTGKTTLLRSIEKETHKSVVVAAPTGIAAINAGGVTVHSLFQMPFGAFIPDENLQFNERATTVAHVNTPKSLLKQLSMKKSKRDILRNMELLIIDEVSMLRADMLDAIDFILRLIRKRKNEAFGGVQVLFIGDMLQLPPVVKNDEWIYLQKYYHNAYFFSAKVFQETSLVHVALEKVYRQSDPLFVEVLNHLRENKITQDDLKVLNSFYDPDFEQSLEDGYIQLTTHNKIAHEKNEGWLQKIKAKEFKYHAKIEGDFNENQFPNEDTLRLKKGAQVMFIKNDYSGESRYFNGKIGRVSSLSNDSVYVKFDDGEEVNVEPYVWENKKYVLNKETNEVEEQIIGEFHQYPLRLAWAITVHKSQGLTFDKAIIDVGRAFAAGQTYVALSRLTSLDGLVLSSPISARGIDIDRHLSHFTQSNQTVEELTPILKEQSKNYIYHTLYNSYNFQFLSEQLLEHVASYIKDGGTSKKQAHREWAKQIHEKVKQLVKIGNKFIHEVHKTITEEKPGYILHLLERVNKANKYFDEQLKAEHTNIQNKLTSLDGVNGVMGYRNELIALASLFYNHAKKLMRAERLIISYQKNEDLKKNDVGKPDFKIAHKATEVKSYDKPKAKTGEGKKPKMATHIQTYVLFRQGKSMEEIAKERGISLNSVESHFAKLIALGKVDVKEVLSNKKRIIIEGELEETETMSLKAIKESLGDRYSYADIKFVIASIEASKS
ncbi:helix-turn-helix domain-containing protein [Flammeovirga sp. OC4]|uniref:helix-turn-helix domain-containing protein n=1 Tax=Flammeovirga sp. OC4 TaxID=1382345 RepID=UPI0005C569ED|nr:helix-turn-helix domain-containing protein [Flammeovirga sp. OC4]